MCAFMTANRFLHAAIAAAYVMTFGWSPSVTCMLGGDSGEVRDMLI